MPRCSPITSSSGATIDRCNSSGVGVSPTPERSGPSARCRSLRDGDTPAHLLASYRALPARRRRGAPAVVARACCGDGCEQGDDGDVSHVPGLFPSRRRGGPVSRHRLSTSRGNGQGNTADRSSRPAPNSGPSSGRTSHSMSHVSPWTFRKRLVAQSPHASTGLEDRKAADHFLGFRERSIDRRQLAFSQAHAYSLAVGRRPRCG